MLAVLLCLTGIILFAGGPALAESPVLVDCNSHRAVTGHYSLAQLRSALAHIPADMQEYSVCPAAIQRQILIQEGRLKLKRPGSAGSRGSGGSSGALVIGIILLVIVLAGGGFAYAARRRSVGGGGPQTPTSG